MMGQTRPIEFGLQKPTQKMTIVVCEGGMHDNDITWFLSLFALVVAIVMLSLMGYKSVCHSDFVIALISTFKHTLLSYSL